MNCETLLGVHCNTISMNMTFSNITNGDIWKFEVTYLDMNDEDVASYKIGIGNCF